MRMVGIEFRDHTAGYIFWMVLYHVTLRGGICEDGLCEAVGFDILEPGQGCWLVGLHDYHVAAFASSFEMADCWGGGEEGGYDLVMVSCG